MSGAKGGLTGEGGEGGESSDHSDQPMSEAEEGEGESQVGHNKLGSEGTGERGWRYLSRLVIRSPANGGDGRFGRMGLPPWSRDASFQRYLEVSRSCFP